MENDKIIELKHVNKEFDGVKVVDDVNLYIKKGEFVTILGPSGCGKTTTLRMIAGFEMATSGEILLNGVDISNIPPHKRPINTVFQRYALFPHLDVYDNVAFGLKIKKVPSETKKNKDARVQVILECTEQKASGVPGMSRYVTTKNKKNTPERLELKKYNPYLKKMTVHKEIK